MSKVVVRLIGGLGNQLFQYAAARAIASRSEADLLFDLSWFATVADRTYALAPFGINVQIISQSLEPLSRTRALWQKIAHRLVRETGVEKEGCPVFTERQFHFDPALLDLRAPIYLDGYFQSERYFMDCADLIRKELQLIQPPAGKTREMLAVIQTAEAICVHIRRGDYVANASTNAFHGTCSLDYYLAGVRLLARDMHEPHVFVFSDDPRWVRDNLRLDTKVTVVDIHGPEQAHEDLRLMTACRHFVIANSSLSWWGAWLGRHAEKKVIAPQQWFANAANNTRDLLPPGWMRI